MRNGRSSFRGFVVSALPALCVGGCSTDPGPGPSHPIAAGAPSSSVAAERPSDCEVAKRLVAVSGTLRTTGFLARADRALGEALARCPAQSQEISALRKAISTERDDDGSRSPDDLAAEAAELVSRGSPDLARRKRERALRAKERRAGASTTIRIPSRGGSIDFMWAKDGSAGALLRGNELSIYDPDLRAVRSVLAMDPRMQSIEWLGSKEILASGGKTGSYQLAFPDAGKTGSVFNIPMEGALDHAMAPDNRTLVLASGTQMLLFDAKKAEVIAKHDLSDTIHSFDVSPSGSRVAVSFSSGALKIYDLPSFRVAAEAPAGAKERSPRFQSETRLVARSEGVVETLDVATGKPIGKPLVNNDCSPMLMGERADRLVWACYAYLEAESAPGRPRLRLSTPETTAHNYTSFSALSASPGGSRIWYSIWGEQGIVDTKTGKLVTRVEAPTFFGVQFRPDDRRIAAIRGDLAALWTSDLQKDERTVVEDASLGIECTTLGVSPNEALVLVDFEGAKSEASGEDPAGDITATLRIPGNGHQGPTPLGDVGCKAQLTLDASRAALLRKGHVDILEMPSGVLRLSVPLEKSRYEEARLAPSGDLLVLSTGDKIRAVEASGGKELRSWRVKGGLVGNIYLSPSGRRFVVVTPREARVYDVDREEVTTLSSVREPLAFVGEQKLVWPNGKEVILFDLPTGNARKTKGPDRVDRLVTFPSGTRVLASTNDGLYLLDTALEESPLRLGDRLLERDSAASLPSGKTLVVYRHDRGLVEVLQTRSGRRLGELRRLDKSTSVYVSDAGNIEVLGPAHPEVKCLFPPGALAFSECADRYVETGLWARTLAGRGCTAEDVGDACE